MPGTVIETARSREEYSQLDTPGSPLDSIGQANKDGFSIEIQERDVRIKTVESQGDFDDANSIQNMKNEAAKKALGNPRAESALLNRTARSPLHENPSSGKKKNATIEFMEDLYQDSSQPNTSTPTPKVTTDKGTVIRNPNSRLKRGMSNHFYVNDYSQNNLLKHYASQPINDIKEAQDSESSTTSLGHRVNDILNNKDGIASQPG